jgi:dolichol-phosphate mannosyltransferase
MGGVGLGCFALGLIGVTYLTVRWVVSRLDVNPENDVNLHQRAAFYYSIAVLLLGAQFMSIGFLAELFTAYTVRDVETYSIKETTLAQMPDRETTADVDSPAEVSEETSQPARS